MLRYIVNVTDAIEWHRVVFDGAIVKVAVVADVATRAHTGWCVRDAVRQSPSISSPTSR